MTVALAQRNIRELDATDDDILLVNQLKAKMHAADAAWNAESNFDQEKDRDVFRQYETACDLVKTFYKEQHTKQTVEFNIKVREGLAKTKRDSMSVWDALIKLDGLVDDSDPDTELSQIEHALQTAEAMRRDGKPRWMQLTGLIHDMGKMLYFYDADGQWDVVGDTFPVGCKYSDKIVYPDTFVDNPDYCHPVYSTELGIYEKHCGLDNVMLSWGHDEYLYHLAKEQSTLPEESLAMIRFHSFYPWHSEGAYSYLMNGEKDERAMKAVLAFNPYDLYSKNDERCDVAKLKDYYCELIDEFFPNKLVQF
ncbi:hypothetical protein BABINDRAFT_163099 [Babjeviella inositovora NRRL Y-12698]|uniref:Inositol oxygenase n=1 Tax=Babjeviella inositovora NRRL Y-12698 TaxID=984486 RepID=A0A1E3QKT7_9ASCO|nr:uncharacterized protein BABINDRAFT_163099 [Babjeviella inositovora NRRL Y-12698]ODQ78074.1 hypothetical protein BABINDRAFT_163099 [Babjeviella inositovora NRRL Y-12698]